MAHCFTKLKDFLCLYVFKKAVCLSVSKELTKISDNSSSQTNISDFPEIAIEKSFQTDIA